MVRRAAEVLTPVLRTLLLRWCALLGAITAAALIYQLYGFIFPFVSFPSGVCRRCGVRTALLPGGWASFCERHSTQFGILQAGMVIAEATFLVIAAIALWLILRLISYWGGRRTSAILILICGVFLIMFMVISHQHLSVIRQFAIALFIMIFVISAVYVDSMESIIVAITAAFALAVAIAFIIKLFEWALIGYMGMFPAAVQ